MLIASKFRLSFQREIFTQLLIVLHSVAFASTQPKLNYPQTNKVKLNSVNVEKCD